MQPSLEQLVHHDGEHARLGTVFRNHSNDGIHTIICSARPGLDSKFIPERGIAVGYSRFRRRIWIDVSGKTSKESLRGRLINNLY